MCSLCVFFKQKTLPCNFIKWKEKNLCHKRLIHSKNLFIKNVSKNLFLSLFEKNSWPFVNLGIGTSALELGLELELILQTPSFTVPLGLWTPHFPGWWLRMRGPHQKRHVTLRYRGHVTNKKRYIATFTRSIDSKLSRVEN